MSMCSNVWQAARAPASGLTWRNIGQTPPKEELGVEELILEHASGLRWRNIGSATPKEGTELTNPKLSDALKGKTWFTYKEWDSFGILEPLKLSHFIKSLNSFFRPTGLAYALQHPTGLKWHNVGSTRPKTGVELTDPELAEALLFDTDSRFTNEEFDSYGIDSLDKTHYIECVSWGKWRETGIVRPKEGQEIMNAKLAAALTYKTDFSHKELIKLGIGAPGVKWEDVGTEEPMNGFAIYNAPLKSALEKKLQDAETNSLGLKWELVGSSQPKGVQFENEGLEAALFNGKTEFSKKELDRLVKGVQLRSLRTYSYVKAKDEYFKHPPIEINKDQLDLMKVPRLSYSHYIKVQLPAGRGRRYLKPAAPNSLRMDNFIESGATGLRWKDIGKKPEEGQELVNSKLEKQLKARDGKVKPSGLLWEKIPTKPKGRDLTDKKLDSPSAMLAKALQEKERSAEMKLAEEKDALKKIEEEFKTWQKKQQKINEVEDENRKKNNQIRAKIATGDVAMLEANSKLAGGESVELCNALRNIAVTLYKHVDSDWEGSAKVSRADKVADLEKAIAEAGAKSDAALQEAQEKIETMVAAGDLQGLKSLEAARNEEKAEKAQRKQESEAVLGDTVLDLAHEKLARDCIMTSLDVQTGDIVGARVAADAATRFYDAAGIRDEKRAKLDQLYALIQEAENVLEDALAEARKKRVAAAETRAHVVKQKKGEVENARRAVEEGILTLEAAEWDKIRIHDPRHDDFIKAGDFYYKQGEEKQAITFTQEEWDDFCICSGLRWQNIGPQKPAEVAIGLKWEKVGSEDDDTLGLKWEQVGSEKPTTGLEIHNTDLAADLKVKTTFDKEEWGKYEELLSGHLSSDSYIKVGNHYCKPAKTEALKCIQNEKLAKALEEKDKERDVHGRPNSDYKFTSAELVGFQLHDLTFDTCIKVKNKYFKPARNWLELKNLKLSEALEFDDDGQFEEDQWAEFGIPSMRTAKDKSRKWISQPANGDFPMLRNDHFIKVRDSYFQPSSSGLRADHFIKVGNTWYAPAGGKFFQPVQTNFFRPVTGEFDADEWHDFGVPYLRMGHFVESEGYYFQPTTPEWKLRENATDLAHWYDLSLCDPAKVGAQLALMQRVSASGLEWKKAGGTLQPGGRLLENSKLSEALKTRTVFKEDEWLQFGIFGLKIDDFIRSEGDSFGLAWRNIDTTPNVAPPGREEFKNAKLSHALKNRLEFTRKEFEQFGIAPGSFYTPQGELRYVASGQSFFEPLLAYFKPAKLTSQTGRDLAHMDMSGMNCCGLDLTGSDAHNACLIGTHLDLCNLSKTNMVKTVLAQADVHDTTTAKLASMQCVLLSGTKLNAAQLQGIHMEGQTLGLMWQLVGTSKPKGTELPRGEGRNDMLAEALSAASRKGTDLKFTLKEWKDFHIKGLVMANFIKAGSNYYKPVQLEHYENLEPSDFTEAQMQGATVNQIKLLGATFKEAKLQRAMFAGAVLSNSNFDMADLSNASFEDAMLDKASFVNATITHVTFDGATLTRVQWSGAKNNDAQHSMTMTCSNRSKSDCRFNFYVLPKKKEKGSMKGMINKKKAEAKAAVTSAAFAMMTPKDDSDGSDDGDEDDEDDEDDDDDLESSFLNGLHVKIMKKLSGVRDKALTFSIDVTGKCEEIFSSKIEVLTEKALSLQQLKVKFAGFRGRLAQVAKLTDATERKKSLHKIREDKEQMTLELFQTQVGLVVDDLVEQVPKVIEAVSEVLMDSQDATRDDDDGAEDDDDENDESNPLSMLMVICVYKCV